MKKTLSRCPTCKHGKWWGGKCKYCSGQVRREYVAKQRKLLKKNNPTSENGETKDMSEKNKANNKEMRMRKYRAEREHKTFIALSDKYPDGSVVQLRKITELFMGGFSRDFIIHKVRRIPRERTKMYINFLESI